MQSLAQAETNVHRQNFFFILHQGSMGSALEAFSTGKGQADPGYLG